MIYHGSCHCRAITSEFEIEGQSSLFQCSINFTLPHYFQINFSNSSQNVFEQPLSTVLN